MEYILDLMKQNILFSLIITISLTYLIPKGWGRLFKKIELGEMVELENTINSLIGNDIENAVEDAVDGALKGPLKEFITVKDHGTCPGNNVADVLQLHRDSQQKAFDVFSETIGREIGELKTDIGEIKTFNNEQEQRFYDHITKKGIPA